MGFLDNVFNAIESGAVEKKLASAVDKLEEKLNTVTDVTEKAAQKVEHGSDAAHSAAEKLQKSD
jgi:chemotaxis regulatin CheY-phosphate phosphatase CheZ